MLKISRTLINWRIYYFFPALVFLHLSAAFAQANIVGEKDYIDVSISIFAMNLPEDEQSQRQLNIYPQVRAAEAKYMPALLRATLLDSEQWGAIRIIPALDQSAELMITGSIIKSDGQVLELAIIARDSSGREWINEQYSAELKPGISLLEQGLNIDPFQSLYRQVANDLLQQYEQLTLAQVQHLKALAQLRYAASIAPDAFDQYLSRTAEGLYDYVRLPANNDPFLQRVQEIREHEYIFIDVVDSQYQDFLTEIKPVYDLWRKYKQDLAQNSIDFSQRQTTDSQFRRGSYMALKDSYNNYRWQRMQGQFLDQLSVGFSNEVDATELDLEDSIYRLSGTLAEQYEEWREILRSLYKLQVENE